MLGWSCFPLGDHFSKHRDFATAPAVLKVVWVVVGMGPFVFMPIGFVVGFDGGDAAYFVYLRQRR